MTEYSAENKLGKDFKLLMMSIFRKLELEITSVEN